MHSSLAVSVSAFMLLLLSTIYAVSAMDPDGTRNGYRPIAGGKELNECGEIFKRLKIDPSKPGEWVARVCLGELGS